MNKEDPTLGSVLKEFNLTSEESKRLAVSVLGLIYEAKRAGVPLDGSEAPPTPPVKDVLFELAKLHVSTVAQVAKLNAGFTDQMVSFLRARRKSQEHGKPGSQEIVVIRHPASGELTINNPTKATRTYTLPAAVEFVALGDDPGAYAKLTYTDGGAATGTLAVPPEKSATAHVKVNDQLMVAGRYRARAILPCQGGPSVEVIFELLR